MNFVGITNLTGGTANDTFQFTNAAGGFGTINGGTGVDTLDYSLVTGPITVNAQTKTAPMLTNYAVISSLVGTSSADTFIGANVANSWNIMGVNAGTMAR